MTEKPILLKKSVYDIRAKQKQVVTNPKKIRFWKKLIDGGSLPRNDYKELRDE